MLLRHELGPVEVVVGEAEDEELVRVDVLSGRGVIAILIRKEVIIVGNPKGVKLLAIEVDVWAKSDAFDLRRNLLHRETSLVHQLRQDVKEQHLLCTLDRNGRGSRSVESRDVGGGIEIDLVELFERRLAVVAQAFAVALVDDELVIVKGGD